MSESNEIYLTTLFNTVCDAEKARETRILGEKDAIIKAEKEMAARADVWVLEVLPKEIENAVLRGEAYLDLPARVQKTSIADGPPVTQEHLYRSCLRFGIPFEGSHSERRILFYQLKQLRMKP